MYGSEKKHTYGTVPTSVDNTPNFSALHLLLMPSLPITPSLTLDFIHRSASCRSPSQLAFAHRRQSFEQKLSRVIMLSSSSHPSLLLKRPRRSFYWPRHSVPVSLWLVLLLLACRLCDKSEAALPWCGNPVDDALPPPHPLSPSLNPPSAGSTPHTSALPHALLASTQFTDSHSDWVTCYHAPVFNVHTCPQHCRRSCG